MGEGNIRQVYVDALSRWKPFEGDLQTAKSGIQSMQHMFVRDSAKHEATVANLMVIARGAIVDEAEFVAKSLFDVGVLRDVFMLLYYNDAVRKHLAELGLVWDWDEKMLQSIYMAETTESSIQDMADSGILYALLKYEYGDKLLCDAGMFSHSRLASDNTGCYLVLVKEDKYMLCVSPAESLDCQYVKFGKHSGLVLVYTADNSHIGIVGYHSIRTYLKGRENAC